jgi:hypothetical protein
MPAFISNACEIKHLTALRTSFPSALFKLRESPNRTHYARLPGP